MGNCLHFPLSLVEFLIQYNNIQVTSALSTINDVFCLYLFSINGNNFHIFILLLQNNKYLGKQDMKSFIFIFLINHSIICYCTPVTRNNYLSVSFCRSATPFNFRRVNFVLLKKSTNQIAAISLVA